MKLFFVIISYLIAANICYGQALVPDSMNPKIYSITLDFAQMNLSGICAVCNRNDTIVGTIMNEFGVKAFDFSYNKTKQKTKLTNVVKMMNKWYLRKIISTDISILLRKNNTKKQLSRHELRVSSDSVVLINNKYCIKYKFKQIYETER